MVRAIPTPSVPTPSGMSQIGVDRFGTEYLFSRFCRLVLRRPGGSYEAFAPLCSATDMLVHPDGGVLVAEGQRVVRYMPDGSVIRVAGTGRRGHSADGGPADQAPLRYPTDLAWAADGGLLIADRNDDRVRRVDPLDGTISTLAGSGEHGFGGDGGPATAAPLDWPARLVVGRHGGFAIVEQGYPRPRVRRVGGGGTIHTVAGGGPRATSVAVPRC